MDAGNDDQLRPESGTLSIRSIKSELYLRTLYFLATFFKYQITSKLAVDRYPDDLSILDVEIFYTRFV